MPQNTVFWNIANGIHLTSSWLCPSFIYSLCRTVAHFRSFFSDLIDFTPLTMSYVNIQSLSEANIIWLLHLNICKVSKFYTVKCWDLRGSLTITWKYTTWDKSDTAAAGIQCCCYGDVTLKIPWKTDGHPRTPTPTPTPTQAQTYTISLSRLIWRNREQQCTLFDILQTFRSN